MKLLFQVVMNRTQHFSEMCKLYIGGNDFSCVIVCMAYQKYGSYNKLHAKEKTKQHFLKWIF